MIVTCGDLIDRAQRAAGIISLGQVANAQDSNIGLELLANLIALWQRQRFMTWALQDVAITSTGAMSYPLASQRPNHIDSAFARLLTSPSPPLYVDFPLVIIPTREDYNQITLKQLATFPAAVFYDAQYPTGNLYFWPIPPAGLFELHVSYQIPLPAYASLASPLGLPPEYTTALMWCLALEMIAAYSLPTRPDLMARARASVSVIRDANAAMQPLAMPASLVGGRRTGNISGAVPAFNAISGH